MKPAKRVLLTMRMIAKSIVTPFRPFAMVIVQGAGQSPGSMGICWSNRETPSLD
jgi:hypothetical protein